MKHLWQIFWATWSKRLLIIAKGRKFKKNSRMTPMLLWNASSIFILDIIPTKRSTHNSVEINMKKYLKSSGLWKNNLNNSISKNLPESSRQILSMGNFWIYTEESQNQIKQWQRGKGCIGKVLQVLVLTQILLRGLVDICL